jgi:YVTN family beta-propeller protein
MSLRRVVRLAAMVLPTLLCLSCGQVYRPVVIPCSEGGIPGCPQPTPAIPGSFHSVFAISANVPGYPGGAMQIDVSGDAIIAQTPTGDVSAPNLGNVPTNAATLPNNSRVFVTSAGSIVPGGIDVLSSFTPASGSPLGGGFGPVATIGLQLGSQPVFVNTTQNTAVYVANFGTNSVSAVSLISNVVTNTAPVGVQPVSLAETPDGNKLYVVNQGDNTVNSFNILNLTPNTVTGFAGVAPVWVVARNDSQKVYVLTQGDGQLVTIDTATDTVTSSLPVGGPGANFIFYDPHLNRLYVTNPQSSMLYIFSDTGGANDTPIQLASISFAAGQPTCPAKTTTACLPTSVTALADGSRFYVASYQTAAACPDTFVGTASQCVIPSLAVFNANSFALQYPNAQYPSAPTMTLLTYPPFGVNLATNQYQYAVPRVATCVSPVYPTLYAPPATRFRMFTTASTDSSHVYVGMCDAGVIAVINTSGSNTNNSGGTTTPPDTLITDLPAAYSAGPIQPNGLPPNQNPIFMLTGQ